MLHLWCSVLFMCACILTTLFLQVTTADDLVAKYSASLFGDEATSEQKRALLLKIEGRQAEAPEKKAVVAAGMYEWCKRSE